MKESRVVEYSLDFIDNYDSIDIFENSEEELPAYEEPPQSDEFDELY